MFFVKRHGGNVKDVWKSVYENESEERARKKFLEHKERIKGKGGVMLLKNSLLLDRFWKGYNEY